MPTEENTTPPRVRVLLPREDIMLTIPGGWDYWTFHGKQYRRTDDGHVQVQHGQRWFYLWSTQA